MKETEAKVNIAGVIADIEIKQVYKNEGERTIEAVYVFPMGVRAAIHGIKMKIGKRIIQARIEKRQEAKRRYEEAKKAGKMASLLEQKRPNVFQMHNGALVRLLLYCTMEWGTLLPSDLIADIRFPSVIIVTRERAPVK